ncbi:MAG: ABC transporter permease [Eubacterium sp.]|jgi:putative ABC transport system permease protein|nr:ABC transporter permease [Eubacterium sp.]
MIRFIKQKLIHKKWMVVCLLIGNILLAAIASSNPMYQDAALEKTLKSKFSQYIEETNTSPGILTFRASMNEGKGQEKEYKRMLDIASQAAEQLGVKQNFLINTSGIAKVRGTFLQSRGNKTATKSLRIAAMTDLAEHVNILTGEDYGSSKLDDGTIPVILSQRAMSKLDVVLHDEIEFAKLKNSDGSNMKIKIVGVFDAKDYEDPFWVKSPNEYYVEVFMNPDLFQNTFINLDGQKFNVSTDINLVFDYESVRPSQVDGIVDRTENLRQTANTGRFSAIDEPDFLAVLRDYQTAAKKVTMTLLILQIPVLSLLLAFIFMISRQMLDLEQNEIALLKSRGSSKGQILLIYFLQSLILSSASSVVGVPIGYFMTKALGSTNGFLEFIQRKALHVRMGGGVFVYTLGAIIISVAFMVLPVIRDANVSIVNVKQKRNRNAKNIFSRVYLDVIMLIVSLYGLYSFTARREQLMKSMLEGDSIDPFLFICSSLFIISASLVGLRLQPLMIKLVYYIGRKHWKPAFFASFLQIIRTRKKQGFMMVFLMFTVSLGIFNATVARTILSNSEKGIRYTTGADLVLQQPWEDNSLLLSYYPDLELTYTEPDFGVYESMEGVAAAAKVYKNSEIVTSYTKNDGNGNVKTTLMAIDTKSFGKTVSDFQADLLPVHINRYLNAMAKRSDAVLLSSNYHTQYGMRVGDSFTYKNEEGVEAKGVVFGFMDYFPGYVAQTHSLNEEETLVTTDNYLIVANLAQVQQNFNLRPYQVWLKTDGSSRFIYDYAKEHNITYTTFEDVSAKLVEVRNDALFQGTNGILTMSFIVILILCCTGFLIYWILSIRQRELLFGVFRAMGMTRREVIQMLVNEQIFSSGVSIVIGTVIGLLASKMFVPLVQIFYASTDQAIPLEVVNKPLDMIRLFSIIGIVIVVCMVVLGKLISKINISQALKLGED